MMSSENAELKFENAKLVGRCEWVNGLPFAETKDGLKNAVIDFVKNGWEHEEEFLESLEESEVVLPKNPIKVHSGRIFGFLVTMLAPEITIYIPEWGSELYCGEEETKVFAIMDTFFWQAAMLLEKDGQGRYVPHDWCSLMSDKDNLDHFIDFWWTFFGVSKEEFMQLRCYGEDEDERRTPQDCLEKWNETHKQHREKKRTRDEAPRRSVRLAMKRQK